MTQTYVALWPVLDESRPLPDLQAEALPDLYSQLRLIGVSPAALPTFGLIEDDPLSPTGLTLTARVDVTQ